MKKILFIAMTMLIIITAQAETLNIRNVGVGNYDRRSGQQMGGTLAIAFGATGAIMTSAILLAGMGDFSKVTFRVLLAGLGTSVASVGVGIYESKDATKRENANYEAAERELLDKYRVFKKLVRLQLRNPNIEIDPQLEDSLDAVQCQVGCESSTSKLELLQAFIQTISAKVTNMQKYNGMRIGYAQEIKDHLIKNRELGNWFSMENCHNKLAASNALANQAIIENLIVLELLDQTN